MDDDLMDEIRERELERHEARHQDVRSDDCRYCEWMAPVVVAELPEEDQ